MTEVTQILHAIERGDTSTTDRLLPLVYDELRKIAASKLRRESPGHTLQTTALVHEAYLRLIGGNPSNEFSDFSETNQNGEPSGDGISWDSRGHFFAAAAEAMRRILIDNARRKKQQKRGGDRDRVEFDHVEIAADEQPVDLIALDEALNKLEEEHPDKSHVVKLRYFGGLTIEQCARALDISEPTVKRHWLYARAWLKREMGSDSDA